MIFNEKIKLFICHFIVILYINNCICNSIISEKKVSDNALEKLVKLFSIPGAFNRVDEILGENLIDESSAQCPEGEDGMECRRAEARRSVDCPTGDCYCYSCAVAGPELWASCCRERSKCCSHLAAACRNCDHPILIPFCIEHFNKCLSNKIHNDSSTYDHTGISLSK
ncbi:hypothetical protein PV328_006461 [Microctonus aethiopoides]|uniref:Uncharacterized protein n=1 Tax=Microctonus aethiopoides TaxID=144406 RepID=A0AA39KTJ0_9HYME|nr:hypothetical protein PV328_006461 [Microctonus aethiopoides]